MNCNVYPLKNTNSYYLLLNTTIIPLCNGKISLIFLWGPHLWAKKCQLCFNGYDLWSSLYDLVKDLFEGDLASMITETQLNHTPCERKKPM